VNDTDVAARLAEALSPHSFIGFRIDNHPACICGWVGAGFHLVEWERHVASVALLPVVREIADQWAAEELEAAAENFHLNISGRDQLRARAAALRGATDV
jgi:hypothetical protein